MITCIKAPDKLSGQLGVFAAILLKTKIKNTCVSGNPTLPKLTGETKFFFQVFLGKNISLCILKGKCKMPFKMHKIIIFFHGKMPFKMNKILFFFRKKKQLKK